MECYGLSVQTVSCRHSDQMGSQQDDDRNVLRVDKEKPEVDGETSDGEADQEEEANEPPSPSAVDVLCGGCDDLDGEEAEEISTQTGGSATPDSGVRVAGGRASKPDMEKRRRARMNQSLAALREVLAALTGEDMSPSSKHEKADVLETAVEHLHNLRRRKVQGTLSCQEGVTQVFQDGYRECIQQAKHYLSLHVCEAGDEDLGQRLGMYLEERILRYLPIIKRPTSINLGLSSSSSSRKQAPRFRRHTHPIVHSNLHTISPLHSSTPHAASPMLAGTPQHAASPMQTSTPRQSIPASPMHSGGSQHTSHAPSPMQSQQCVLLESPTLPSQAQHTLSLQSPTQSHSVPLSPMQSGITQNLYSPTAKPSQQSRFPRQTMFTHNLETLTQSMSHVSSKQPYWSSFSVLPSAAQNPQQPHLSPSLTLSADQSEDYSAVDICQIQTVSRAPQTPVVNCAILDDSQLSPPVTSRHLKVIASSHHSPAGSHQLTVSSPSFPHVPPGYTSPFSPIQQVSHFPLQSLSHPRLPPYPSTFPSQQSAEKAHFPHFINTCTPSRLPTYTMACQTQLDMARNRQAIAQQEHTPTRQLSPVMLPIQHTSFEGVSSATLLVNSDRSHFHHVSVADNMISPLPSTPTTSHW